MLFIFIIFMTLVPTCIAWSVPSNTESDEHSSMVNVTENKLKALEKFGFGSSIFKQIVAMKIEADKIRLALQNSSQNKDINDTADDNKALEKEIDAYNVLSNEMRDFLNKLALRLAESKPFDKKDHEAFCKDMADKWLSLQSKLIGVLDALKVVLDQEKNDTKKILLEEVENIKNAAKEVIDTGLDELSKMMTSHISRIQSYFTEKETPVLQQDLIRFLLDQQLQPIGSPDRSKMHTETAHYMLGEKADQKSLEKSATNDTKMTQKPIKPVDKAMLTPASPPSSSQSPSASSPG